MRHTVICGLPGSTILFIIHYLINVNFRKTNVTENEMFFDFP